MIGKRQVIGSAMLAAASLGAVLTAGCSATSPAPASAPVSAVTEHQATPGAASDRLQRAPAASPEAVRLGLLSKTTALIGKKVMTRGEKDLGKVEDLILELSTGEVVAVLVSAGSEGQITPVPARCFWTATKNKILLSADRKTFESAPRLAKADLTQTMDAGRLNESFLHFGQGAPAPPAPGSGGFCSAMRLIGLRLVSQTNEALGQVEDTMLDVPVGRISYLVIQPVAVAGAQTNLYVVPPQPTRIDAAGASLVLKADQAHFLAGPHFQQGYWTDMARPELAAAVLQHYNLQPGVSGQADPGHEQSRGRIETTNAPSQVVPARSDQDITTDIVREIIRDANAPSMRDLKITTTRGRVKLTGRVKNEKQKQQLGAAAAHVVGADNVDNQLTTPASR